MSRRIITSATYTLRVRMKAPPFSTRTAWLIFFAGIFLVNLVGCGPLPTVTPAPPPTSFVVALPPSSPTPSPFEEGARGDHAIGPEDAYLTIMVYCDFQTPACAEVAAHLATLRERYAEAGGVRTVWRHFPMTEINNKAGLALQAAEAAAAQDAFWPMHDLLLTRQTDWANQTPDAFRATVTTYAEELGLDADAFNAALDAGAYAPLIGETRARAVDFGLTHVPALGFNGVRYRSGLQLWALDAMTRATLLEQRWYPDSPTLIIDLEAEYRATLVTEKGDIVIALFVNKAPVAVNNFVFLAQEGWYDGNTFFNVADLMAVTGDPTDTGLGSPGYRIIDEADNGLTFAVPGMVAMLRPLDRPNSAGSQFFITKEALSPDFDGRYTIFGRVVAGMETVMALRLRDPFTDPPPPPGDRIEYVIIEKLQPTVESAD